MSNEDECVGKEPRKIVAKVVSQEGTCPIGHKIGDIVEFNWGSDKKKSTVFFSNGAFVVKLTNELTTHVGNGGGNKYINVLGNIYENPELLK